MGWRELGRAACAAGALLWMACERPRVSGPFISEVPRGGGEAAEPAAQGSVVGLGAGGAVQLTPGPDGDVMLAGAAEDAGAWAPAAALEGAAVFVARLTPEGAPRWVRGLRPLRSGGRSTIAALATAPGGDLLVAGTTTAGLRLGEVQVAPGPFLARLSAEGQLRWGRAFTAEGKLRIAALAVDATGALVLAGEAAGACDLGGGLRRAPVGSATAWVARLSAEGAHRWSRTYPSDQGQSRARAVVVGPLGRIHVVGDYAGAVTFGGSTFFTVQPQAPFVATLSPEGEHLWSGDLGGAAGRGLAVAAGAHQVFIAGSYSGRFFFRGATHTSDWQDAFVVAFSADGDEQWARSFAASASALALDDAGQLLVAGAHDGGGMLGIDGPSGGLYVAKLLPHSGAPLWGRAFQGSGPLRASLIALAPRGETLLAGSIQRSTAADSPARDAFLLRLQRDRERAPASGPRHASPVRW